MNILKCIAQDRKALLYFLLVPILAFLGVGFIFMKIYIENIPFGIVDLDNSSLSRTMVRQFKLHPGLKVEYYADSEQELQTAVKSQRVWGGLVIPRRFYHDVLKSQSPNVMLLINGTNMVVGNNVQAYCSAVLGTVGAGFQLTVLEGRGLGPYLAQRTLSTFSFGERILYEPRLSYLGYLMSLLLVYMLQTSYLTQFIIPLLIQEKSRIAAVGILSGEVRSWLWQLAARVLSAATVLGISSYIALKAGEQCFGLPALGNFWEHFALVGGFLLALTGVSFVIAALVNNLTYFLEFYAAFSMVTLLTAGGIWPEYMMPNGFAVTVKALWPMFDVLYPLKALHLKALGWDMVLPALGSSLLYALIWGLIGITLYFNRISAKTVRLEGGLSE